MKKALEGIKVVDLTSALSGPFCTMMLADYGADVLKIEPLHGDQCRTWGPIDEKSGESGFYCYVNRNKKGATLNLKSNVRNYIYITSFLVSLSVINILDFSVNLGKRLYDVLFLLI